MVHEYMPDLGYKVPIRDEESTRTCWTGESCRFDEEDTTMTCEECPNRDKEAEDQWREDDPGERERKQ